MLQVVSLSLHRLLDRFSGRFPVFCDRGVCVVEDESLYPAKQSSPIIFEETLNHETSRLFRQSLQGFEKVFEFTLAAHARFQVDFYCRQRFAE